jgi:hypothetical protein
MVVRHSPGSHRLTLGADKAYDVHEFVDDLRDLNVTPHIAQNTTNRSSAIDTRTTRRPRLRHELAEAQANGGAVRLGQDHRWARPASFEPKRILLTVHAPGDLLRFRAAAGSPAPIGDLPLPLLGKLDPPIIRQRAPTGSKP